MQLTARIGVLTAALSLAAAPAAQAGITDPPTGSTLFRVFNDSEGIAVRSYMGDYRFELPRDYQLGLHLNNERVVIPGISAPVGSTEAIDAITTASRPISGNAYSDYIKVRNEVQSTLDRPHAGLEYYYSTERVPARTTRTPGTGTRSAPRCSRRRRCCDSASSTTS